jgi:hypothetical protein
VLADGKLVKVHLKLKFTRYLLESNVMNTLYVSFLEFIGVTTINDTTSELLLD